ncbi:MAG: host attachment protein [Vitreoscilla sp.]
MPSNTTWVVVADEGRARILSRDGPDEDLKEIETIVDPAARAHNADFRHDAYGRRSPGAGALPSSATSSAGEEKLDHEAELFAHRLSLRLTDAHRQHRFDTLRIAAAPRFLGRLRKALDKSVSALVDQEIDKDLLQLDARTLTQRLYSEAPRH